MFSIAALFTAAALTAQPSPCVELTAKYDNASKLLARAFVDRTPAREAAIRDEAMMTLELMKAHDCPLPTSIPSPSGYIDDAARCATATLRGRPDDTACDMETWSK